MDFKFSDEQEMFREEVREFLRQELPADWDGTGYGEEAATEIGQRITSKLAARKWLAMALP